MGNKLPILQGEQLKEDKQGGILTLERKNLWAPWRIGYIQGLSEEPGTEKNDEAGGCFFCRYLEHPEDDDKNYVLWRTKNCIVVLNHFPYNNGHLLIAPIRHIPDLEQASDAEMLEMTKLFRETQRALGLAIKPHGFNLGMNIGRCAGAGLPEHLHVHLVPRWNGDTNFMTVCNDTDVISQSLKELFDLLKTISVEHNLPSL